MKATKTLFLGLIAVCFSFAAIADAGAAVKMKATPGEDAAANKIIRLCSYGDICACPVEATVNSGTTVIWVNQSKMPVKIHFDGKQIKEVGKNHIHFMTNSKGTYVSNTIPTGALATLSFVEKGQFNYVAETIPSASNQPLRRARVFNGTIIVK